MFCLCAVPGCYVDVAFPCVGVLSDVDPAGFYVCPVLQQLFPKSV